MAPIQVMGEVSPLDPQHLFSALIAAASSDAQLIRNGTKQLQSWEKTPGYYSQLQVIFTDYSLPIEVRHLSIIQLKNGIDKYWRRGAANAISKDEKETIKAKVLEAGVNEPAHQLALQNALLIAKIVRYEFPNDWPTVIPTVLSFLRQTTESGSNPQQLSRTLLILVHIIKELATGRLLRTKASLHQVTPEILEVLGGIYMSKVDTWYTFVTRGGDDEGGAVEALEQSLLSLKVLRRLLIAGYDHPNRDENVRQFWTVLQEQLGQFFHLVSKNEFSSYVQKLVEKHLIQFSKLHVEMATIHPADFTLLPSSISLVQSYGSLAAKLGETYGSKDMSVVKIGTDGDADEEEKPLQEKVGLKALLLIRACIKMAFHPAQTFKYQKNEDKEEKKASVSQIKSQLLTEEFVIQMMELLVTKFFVFRASDLREWEDEPEEWEKREEEIADAWEFSIRACSEKLFLDLVINFKDLIMPKLLAVFYNYANPLNQEILLKDSLYAAIGLAGPCIEKEFDFNGFLESTLIQEVQIQQPGYNLLRRRVATLLGQWVPIKPEELNRPVIYQIFSYLLDKSDPLNDQVVRVTAGRQLRNVLDPFEFKVEDFLPHATAILQKLMMLMKEVELTETKMALLETVRVAVVKLEHHISPFTDDIISLLPPLWEESGDGHLMKQAILTLLTCLINSMKSESTRYHSIIIPLIAKSIAVDGGSEALSYYLLEEALELWSAAVMQCPAPISPEVLSLVPNIFSRLESGSETLRQVLEIGESYLLLAPREMLDEGVRTSLLTSLQGLLGTSNRELNTIVPRLAESFIQCGGDLVDQGADTDITYTAIAKSFIDSSFLVAILQELHAAHIYHQGSGPRRERPNCLGIVETYYFNILARLCLASPQIFVSAISAATNSSEEESMSWLLTEWFLHQQDGGDINAMKLHVLALTQLLSLCQSGAQPPNYILTNLQSYISMWTSITTELSDGIDADSGEGGDYLIIWKSSDEPIDDPYEVPETKRRALRSRRDPVFNIGVQGFVKEKFQVLVQTCGGQDAFQRDWLINVDKDVVEAFASLRII